MVIHLGFPASFRQAIRYNEKKVERGEALCIHAGNFILDAPQLALEDKVSRFERLDRLKPNYPERIIHASLNFHPSDKPDKEKFIRVTADYLREVGFANQPWLLYQHTDTQVPHVHLVVSKVTNEGRILSTYTGFVRMQEILRTLEIRHHLATSQRRERNPQLALSTATPVRPKYGQTLTRDAIASVLAHVLPSYNYSNLTELNAILREYGIWADSGKPGGTLAAIRGLSYQMLDGNGREIGKRVGASVIDFNPGLDYLETRFDENSRRNPSDLSHLSARVQLAGFRAPDDWRKFTTNLQSAGIGSIPLMNARGQVYDIVFIDHTRKLAISAHRLPDSAAGKHIHLRPSIDIPHQRALVRDMNRARLQLSAQSSADEDARKLQLKKERQHKISR